VQAKGRNDFVSEIDHAAERDIIETVRRVYPEHAFLGEESGRSGGDSEVIWIIDPLDGTTNFLHGFPQFCVSIALQHKGVITQGVVYDPNRNDRFTATRGAGADRNDRRLRVSRRDRFDEALIAPGFPFRGHSTALTSLMVVYVERSRIMSAARTASSERSRRFR
jgi:myo-inositol-1(or 4)-monophosphatase